MESVPILIDKDVVDELAKQADEKGYAVLQPVSVITVTTDWWLKQQDAP